MNFDEIKQPLDEVRMASSNLRQFLNSAVAAEFKAGFEAELCFSGLGEPDDDNAEWEMDEDQDEEAYSIDGVIDFFRSGDFADLGPRQADRVRADMSEQYHTWLSEQAADDFYGDKEEIVRQWILNNVEDAENNEELDELVQDEIDNQGEYYQQAYDEYTEEAYEQHDERDWLRYNNWNWMSQIAGDFDLTFPHMTRVGGSEGGFNIDNAQQLAQSLSEVTGMKAEAVYGHGNHRREGTWALEEDPSIHPDDEDDMPVEIISPPLSLPETVEMMSTFFEWAAENGAYSNRSTGFHMSVSIPDHVAEKIDFVKLALFLGDNYVLDQFKRTGNTYCASALGHMKARIKHYSPETLEQAFKHMRNHTEKLATMSLASSYGYGKYYSINPKEKYIEFRSAGGTDYFDDIEKIQDTLIRYAYALSIASNPQAERQEYMKKLYQLYAPSIQGDGDTVKYFAQYIAGQLTASELKSLVKNVQQQRGSGELPGRAPKWKIVNRHGVVNELKAQTHEAAYKEALELARRLTSNPDLERIPEHWNIVAI